MLRTLTLDYIVNEYKENIFDFDYPFTDVTVGNMTYTKETIQNAFIDYFLYYQIGYSTIAEFKWRLKRVWLSEIPKLQALLSVQPESINLVDENENYNTTRNNSLNRSYSNTNDNRYSDTPNQNMGTQTNPNYLTDRTIDNFDGNTTETHNDTVTHTRTKSRNSALVFNELYNKIHNVLYEFYKKFNSLFITDVILSGGILCSE